MPSILRSVSKRAFVFLTIVITVLYLLACATWYIPPGKYWMLALLGVGFAFLLLGIVCLFIFWIIFRSRWFIVPALAMLVSWMPIRAFFGFHLFAGSNVKKTPGALRIMQWNVARFDEMSNPPGSGKSKRREILDFIRLQNPDIICMQEFLESNKHQILDANISYFRDSLGYRYYSYAMDYQRPDKRYEHGIAIFSKFPILNTRRWKFGGPKMYMANQSYLATDIEFQGQTIRIFTTHLQSLLFTRAEFKTAEDIALVDDSTIEKSSAIFKKFRRAYGFREQQADLVKLEMEKSPYPVIICADFNDVPNSYTYHRIKGDLQDVFTAKGFGIGRTFTSISPTLRIDYIMTDPRFRVVQCQNPHPRLSDHFPVIADLTIEKAE